MKRGLSATLGVGMLLSGSTACGFNAHPSSSAIHATTSTELPQDLYGIAPEDRDYLSKRFEMSTSYLEHIGKLAILPNLLLLGDADTFSCQSPEKTTVLTSQSLSEYCPTADTVIITAGDINAARYQGMYHTQLDLIEAHELGHAIQNKEGGLNSIASTISAHAPLEVQATCYAGEIINHFDSSEVKQIGQYLLNTPTDPSHGTQQEQAGAFMSGAAIGEPCIAIG